jgi:hypothetical protein
VKPARACSGERILVDNLAREEEANTGIDRSARLGTVTCPARVEKGEFMKKMIGLLVLGVSALTVTFMVTPARAACPVDVGAELAAACPCSGPAGLPSGRTWKNHGQHQSCVVRFRNDLRRQGCLTADAQRTIASCSARSTCGKADAVLCCAVSSTGICSDTSPGDGSKDGTCSNDATVACDSATDCTILSGPRVRKDALACTVRGGYSSGTGSVCGGCAPAVACCLTAGGCQVMSAADCTPGVGTANAVPSCDPSPCP